MSGQSLLVLLQRQLAHEAAVQPAQLALVEDRRRASHPLDREALDQLVGAEDRRVVLGAPPEQSEVVADSGRQVAVLTQLLHRGGAVSLRQLAPVRPVQERQVRVARRSGVERAQDQQLLRRVREVVVAANDVGDLHLGVVDGNREVVQRGAVAPCDHEVVLGPVLEPHRPADQVLDHGHPVVRDAQADRRARAHPGLAAVSGAAVRLLPGANVLGGGRVADRRDRPRPTPATRSRWRWRRSYWLSGPSSQSSSSHRSASRICSTFSGTERSRSVSSIRSTRVPPERLARSQL